MAAEAPTGAAPTEAPTLLTEGRTDRIRVQVGHRAHPCGPAHEQFLLDLAVDEEEGLTEEGVLVALEPVLYAGTDVRRHHSVHRHRWHSTWGAAAGGLEIGLLVTTGSMTTESGEASLRVMASVFAGLLGRSDGRGQPLTHEAALIRARQAAASAYALDPEALAVSAEEHHTETGSWTVDLRTGAGDRYRVVVGFVDGYAGSAHVRHPQPIEVIDSVGAR